MKTLSIVLHGYPTAPAPAVNRVLVSVLCSTGILPVILNPWALAPMLLIHAGGNGLPDGFQNRLAGADALPVVDAQVATGPIRQGVLQRPAPRLNGAGPRMKPLRRRPPRRVTAFQ